MKITTLPTSLFKSMFLKGKENKNELIIGT